MPRSAPTTFAHLLLSLLVALLATALSPTSAAAQDLKWQDEWEEYGWINGAVTASLFAGAGVVEGVLPERDKAVWIGGVFVDDLIRDEFVADTPDVIVTSARTSDALLLSLVALPAVIDPALTWLGHGERKAAVQMALISAQSMAITLFLTSATKYLVGRRRPPVGDCLTNPFLDPFCEERARVSFPSGHTSMAFTGAALMCAHHEAMPVYGDGWDRAACYLGLTAAATTGFLRITSNNHYFSDIFIGGILGFSMGYFLPKWLHYGFADDEEEGEASQVRGTLMPVFDTNPTMPARGLSYQLRF